MSALPCSSGLCSYIWSRIKVMIITHKIFAFQICKSKCQKHLLSGVIESIGKSAVPMIWGIRLHCDTQLRVTSARSDSKTKPAKGILVLGKYSYSQVLLNIAWCLYSMHWCIIGVILCFIIGMGAWAEAGADAHKDFVPLSVRPIVLIYIGRPAWSDHSA